VWGLFRVVDYQRDRNYVYQNVCVNSTYGMAVAGGGLSNDWLFNNTFYNVTHGWFQTPRFGGRFWNNIIVNGIRDLHR
jgi:hypothetical protein